MRKPLTGPSSFDPKEWDKFFSGLSPDARRDAATRLCRAVVSEAELTCPAIEQVLDGLASGHPEAHVFEEVQALVDRLEAEYDALVGDDESKLACTEPPVEAAFTRARAGWTLKFALEGKLWDMAYEAWNVLNDQNQVRRLVGMAIAPDVGSKKRWSKWWQFWARGRPTSIGR